MALSKSEIFAAIDAKTLEVKVPEWGGTILLRCMTGACRNEYEYWASQQVKETVPDYRGIRERLIIYCAVDERGEQLFKEEDLSELGKKNSEVIDRLHEKCQEICGMSEESIEDAEKN